MATLVLTAIGTAIGGPLGGAIGGLIGNQIDHAVFGGSRREGPRLKELGVSTSSYGSAIPRHLADASAGHDCLGDRSPGTEGGGWRRQGQPVRHQLQLFGFVRGRIVESAHFRGRPRLGGRQPAPRSGGRFQGRRRHASLYGHGDQPLDPLIASAEPTCPAFRGLAYCVFESLQLADFGNRIPALTFEVIADEGQVTVEPARTARNR